jgi:hypothetical protein
MNVRRTTSCFTKNTLVAGAVVAGFSFFSLAYANTITFMTPAGASVADGPVSASATFTTATNSVQVTLTNLLSNPRSAGQLLSDIFFQAGGLTTGTGSANIPSATYINVASNGTTSTGACCADWRLTNTNGVYHLTGLGGNPYSGPDYLIIGPPGAGGTYSNANGSIAHNRPHNPFINQTATFTLGLTGATSSTVISNVIFSFGTEEGSNVAAVPIPAAVWLFVSGLIGLIAFAAARRSLPARLPAYGSVAPLPMA